MQELIVKVLCSHANSLACKLIPAHGPAPQSDFLAVEMRRGKAAFLWDMGSGSTRLEFPDFPIDNNKWHSIYVTR